jgi:omega-hydroxy-beta-dihydromenaquinone-9 sulfotransferase
MTDLHSPTGQADVAFLIGAGRSGTTLLYKLLCLHPQVAYISNLEHRMPWLPASATGRLRLRRYASKLRHWFHDQGNAYMVQRPVLMRLAPVPVEGEAVYARCGIPLYPEPGYQPDERSATRLRTRFSTLRQAADARVLVSKRTANNRRIAALHSIFPGARFVSLMRDGREVAASLSRVDWWNDTPLWWDPTRRTPAEAVAQGEDLLRLCARNWVEETEEIARGFAGVPESRVLSVRYEELVATPIEQMRRVLTFLDLEHRLDYEWALKTLKLGHQSPSWRTAWSSQQAELVRREQSEHLTRSGYAS